MKRRILVIDGHDGSGKTTFAHMLAEHYGFMYVKPFSDSLGDLIAWACKKEDFELANKLAIKSVEKILEENKEKVLVFDRHWLSMFTVLPVEFHKMWDRPITICCWTDPKTTVKRLKNREDDDVSAWNHDKFCSLYRDYANKYNIKLINTTDNDISHNFNEICAYLEDNNYV